MPLFSITSYLLAVGAIVAMPVSADTYSTQAGAYNGNASQPISASVQFFESGCVTTPTPSCNLIIELTNNTSNPTADIQEISAVSFKLVSGGTTLTGLGTVSGTITNGTGGAVTVLDSSFNASTTNTTPSRWKLSNTSSTYTFSTITGGSPSYQIIGPGPYTNANNSITGHSPSLEGTVVFTILNVPGLTATSTVSNVTLAVGTAAGALTPSTLTCSGTCNGLIQQPSATPEPLTMFLAGSALLVLGSFRKRLNLLK